MRIEEVIIGRIYEVRLSTGRFQNVEVLDGPYPVRRSGAQRRFLVRYFGKSNYGVKRELVVTAAKLRREVKH